MPLEKLVALVPPPDEVIDAPLRQAFADCEAELGMTLPADFKDLLSVYGMGKFFDYLFAYPLAGRGMNLPQNKALRDGHADARRRHPDGYPYPLYPEADGLLIWGGTYDGHSLCWLTKGEPDTWPVVVWHQRNGDYHLYEHGAVALIVDWVQHTLPAQIVPMPPQDKAWFEPARKLDEVYVYVDGGTGSFNDRVQLLHHIFGPVQTRGASTEDGHSEDHFATARNWRVSYSEWPRGGPDPHSIPADRGAGRPSHGHGRAPQAGPHAAPRPDTTRRSRMDRLTDDPDLAPLFVKRRLSSVF